MTILSFLLFFDIFRPTLIREINGVVTGIPDDTEWVNRTVGGGFLFARTVGWNTEIKAK